MKKLLLISFYWPPSGKASMHWPIAMAEHFSKYGWEPTILTVKEDTVTESDLSFNQSENKIIRTGFWDPFKIYKVLLGKKKDESLSVSETVSQTNVSLAQKLSLWIRMNLFIPDARIGWYYPAIRRASDFLNNNKVDAIITNGPPHSSHLIGKKLSKKFNVPFVPMFIDPWVDISSYKGYSRNRLVLKLDNFLEKSVLKHAQKIIFVTQGLVDYFAEKYDFVKNKSELVHWGYNESSFTGRVKEINTSDIKVILHAGNLYEHQNPRNFWKLLKMKIEGGDKLKLKFVGTIGNEVKRTIEEYGLSDHTEFLGFLPYSEVLTQILNADYLLMCVAEPRHVPGKMFEYQRSGNPIIAFGDDSEEVQSILNYTGAGKIFSYNDCSSDFIDEVEAKEADISKTKNYSRENLVGKIVELLNNITSN